MTLAMPSSALALHYAERLATVFSAELLRAALLLLLVAAVLKLLPSMGAAVRSFIWTGVLLIVTLMPIFSLGSTALAPTGSALHALRFAPAWSLVIASAWLVASLLRAIALATGALRLRQIWRSAEPLASQPPLAQHAVREAQGRVRHATLCLSAQVSRPSVIGFFSPRILIPASLFSRLSATELDHIVLHEVEHLRRYDDWRNLLQKLALVVFPLNPALFWIDRRLAIERELACDESVLQATRSPRSYASCLVHLAEENGFGRHLSLALGAWERRSELARRVHGILAYRFGEQAGRAPVTALMAATLLLGVALAHTPNFVSFTAAPPIASASAVYAEPTLANYQAVGFASRAAAPLHMVEAVAHMPSPARLTRTRRPAPRQPARTVRLHRVLLPRAPVLPRTPARTLVFTSWVISYNSDLPSRLDPALQPHFQFALYQSPLRPDAPQVLPVEALPVAGTILILQL